jgi:hypothetical protein
LVFFVFSGSLSDLIQIQKAGREKRPASRGYKILQMVKTEKKIGILLNQGSLLRERIILWWNSNGLDN